MLDDYRHRWGYAVGFGSITNTIVFLFTGGQYMDFEGGTVVKGEEAYIHVYIYKKTSYILSKFALCYVIALNTVKGIEHCSYHRPMHGTMGPQRALRHL